MGSGEWRSTDLTAAAGFERSHSTILLLADRGHSLATGIHGVEVLLVGSGAAAAGMLDVGSANTQRDRLQFPAQRRETQGMDALIEG